MVDLWESFLVLKPHRLKYLCQRDESEINFIDSCNEFLIEPHRRVISGQGYFSARHAHDAVVFNSELAITGALPVRTDVSMCQKKKNTKAIQFKENTINSFEMVVVRFFLCLTLNTSEVLFDTF